MKLLVARIRVIGCSCTTYEVYIPADKIPEKYPFMGYITIIDGHKYVAPYWLFANDEDMKLSRGSEERIERWREIFELSNKLEQLAIRKAFPEDMKRYNERARIAVWDNDNVPDSENREVEIDLKEVVL